MRGFLLWIVGFFTALGATGLLVVLGLAGEIYDYQDTVDGVHLPPVDAIVCLAGGRGRIAAAGDLWYRYYQTAQTASPVLYISGMGPQSTWNVFARQLRSGVREMIKPENVVLEIESANTEANARWLARYAAQKGWKNILLVTSSYHMRRATHIFEKVLTSDPEHAVRIHTMSVFIEPFDPTEWRTSFHGIEVTFTEYVKGLYYRFFWKPI